MHIWVFSLCKWNPILFLKKQHKNKLLKHAWEIRNEISSMEGWKRGWELQKEKKPTAFSRRHRNTWVTVGSSWVIHSPGKKLSGWLRGDALLSMEAHIPVPWMAGSCRAPDVLTVGIWRRTPLAAQTDLTHAQETHLCTAPPFNIRVSQKEQA